MPVVTDEIPDVSIGIPARDGGVLLKRLLQKVFAQDTPLKYEVYVLDSGSTDGTLNLLEKFPLRVIPIARDTFNWGVVREQLFEEARGKVVVNLSQDAIPARHDWLDRLVDPLRAPGVGVSCGHSIPDPDRGFPQFAWERNGLFYFTREMKQFVARYGRGLSFANTAVRRSVWSKVHIAPQATGEDFGFQIRLHEADVKISFTREAPVLHHHNYSLKEPIAAAAMRGLLCVKWA